MLDIKITRTDSPKEKPRGPLGFGKIFTDHMFIMNYTEGMGWHDPRVVPFQDISLSPACVVFHYGQEMFEGMKAYKGEDGKTFLFRPYKNAARANDNIPKVSIRSVQNPRTLSGAISSTLATPRNEHASNAPEESTDSTPGASL